MSMDWHPITEKPTRKCAYLFVQMSKNGRSIITAAVELSWSSAMQLRVIASHFTHWAEITPPEREA